MKVVILAGGFGTRISEESVFRPKPMIEIGDKPILWHIMKNFSAQGYNEFIICCGYKQHMIKEWFANYYLYNSDVTFDFEHQNQITIHQNLVDPWKVTLVDTGLYTMTGGRIKRIQPYVGEETFLFTYGDGISTVSIDKLVEYHRSHKKIATLTGAKIEQKFGVLDMGEDGQVRSFREKSQMDGSLINSGYMVLEPEIFSYIQGDETFFEKEPLETLAEEDQLRVFVHEGFWKCMDTQRDREQLEELWNSNHAPWKIWN